MAVLTVSFLTISNPLKNLYDSLPSSAALGQAVAQPEVQFRMTIFDIALDHGRERALTRNPYKLSPRELEVATLIGQGLTSREAGEKLAISYKTVETHRAHIMTKLGARNGAHLAYIIGTLAGSSATRPDIVYVEDFRDAFGRTAQDAANDSTPVVVFAD